MIDSIYPWPRSCKVAFEVQKGDEACFLKSYLGKGVFLMKRIKRISILFLLVVSSISLVEAQTKMKVKGLIIARSPNGFALLNENGSDVTVEVTSQTEIKERKKNWFRSAINYSPSDLLVGLNNIHVEGMSDSSGTLKANKIKFTQQDYRTAQSISYRIVPVEKRMTEAHIRIDGRQDRLEAEAKTLSGTTTKLAQDLKKAHTESVQAAGRAQATANLAVLGVDATGQRLSALDDYEELELLIVPFRLNSSTLSDETKLALDILVAQAMGLRGFLIEVKGFASADGSDSYNVRLSQQRAESVERYLTEIHRVPLRRILGPEGYGKLNPLAENSTPEGRERNRRVELRLFVNEGVQSVQWDSEQKDKRASIR
jgi:outer membrane protein OmpA-like peptidoglycan-associated protein